MFTNHIVEYRISVSEYLKEYLPLDVAKIVGSYTYYLRGVSKILGKHNDSVESIIMLPDGRIVTASKINDSSIKIWNPLAPDLANICKHTPSGHLMSVWCLMSLPDGRFISGSSDRTIKIWNTNNESYYCEHNLYTNGGIYRYDIGVLPDGRIINSVTNKIKIWDFKNNGHPVASTICPKTGDIESPDVICCIAVRSDGSIIIGSVYGKLKILDPCTGEIKYTLDGHSGLISCIHVLNDERIVSGSYDDTLKIWDLNTRTCEVTLKGHTDNIKCIAVLPDGRIISGSHDYTLRIWDLLTVKLTGECDAIFECRYAKIKCVTVLPDGQIISGSDDGTVRIWS